MLRIVDVCMPDFWVIENPVGRLGKLIPELGRPFYFNPCDYGDPYTKKTCLWGEFTPPLPLFSGEINKVPPVVSKHGSWHQTKLGGKSERTKEIRSMTPRGFAKAFYNANH